MLPDLLKILKTRFRLPRRGLASPLSHNRSTQAEHLYTPLFVSLKSTLHKTKSKWHQYSVSLSAHSRCFTVIFMSCQCQYESFYLVGNIPYGVSEDQLKAIFSEAGPVVSFR